MQDMQEAQNLGGEASPPGTPELQQEGFERVIVPGQTGNRPGRSWDSLVWQDAIGPQFWEQNDDTHILVRTGHVTETGDVVTTDVVRFHRTTMVDKNGHEVPVTSYETARRVPIAREAERLDEPLPPYTKPTNAHMQRGRLFSEDKPEMGDILEIVSYKFDSHATDEEQSQGKRVTDIATQFNEIANP